MKRLIVLDIDETLVYSTPIRMYSLDHDLEWNGLYIYKRPFLNIFLSELERNYDVAIWSAGSADYVEMIVKNFINIKLQFIYCKQHCVYDYADKFGYAKCFTKPLYKLDHHFPDHEIIIIDDNGHHTIANQGRCIVPEKFYGHQHDYELIDLLTHLKSGSKDHTNWRDKLSFSIYNL